MSPFKAHRVMRFEFRPSPGQKDRITLRGACADARGADHLRVVQDALLDLELELAHTDRENEKD